MKGTHAVVVERVNERDEAPRRVAVRGQANQRHVVQEHRVEVRTDGEVIHSPHALCGCVDVARVRWDRGCRHEPVARDTGEGPRLGTTCRTG